MMHRAISEHGVDIGECRLSSDADIRLNEAYAELSDEERARAASFVFDIDRERYVRAHGFLRRRLGDFLGLSAKDVPIAVAPGGKPYVEGHEASFNLSHSGSHAVVAIARHGDIGIDLETFDRDLEGQLDGLARMCMTDDEQHALAATPADDRIARFLSYWTAKDARMKLTGEGMALEPQTISLDLADGRPVGYLQPLSPEADLRFISLSAPGTICCLAVRR